MELYERVRPKSFDGIVGQDKAVATIRNVIARNGGTPGGKAFYITGPTGMGKTTMARIIANSMPAGVRVMEYSSPAMLTADEMADIHHGYRLAARGLFAMPTAVIVNEAHGMNAAHIRILLGLLEPIPESFVWVFTTSWEGQSAMEDAQIDARALLGRCVSGKPIRLTNQGMAQAAAVLVQQVARNFNLDGQPLSFYVKLANEHNSSVRGMLEAVDAMIGGAA